MHSCVQTFLISIQWTVKFAPIHYLDTVRVDTINIFIVHFFPSIFLPVHFFSPPRCPFHLPPLPSLPNLSSTHFLFFSLQFPSPFHLPPLPCPLNSSSIHFSSFPLIFLSLNLPSQSIRLLLPSFFTSSHTSSRLSSFFIPSHTSSVFHHSSSLPILLASVFHHSSSLPILLPSSIILHPSPYFFRLPSFFTPSHTSSVFHHSSPLPILLPFSIILRPLPFFFPFLNCNTIVRNEA